MTPLLLLNPAAALACGGLFCSPAVAPIDQASEIVVFAIDDVAQTVEAHVSITYEGASDDFAWIVPVPGEPELFPSTPELFARLSSATDPVYSLSTSRRGVQLRNLGCVEFSLTAWDADTDSDGVDVLSEERVGPYDTVVLQADSSAQLLTFLEGAGYDLPADLDPVLAPYVAAGQSFVALRLSAGNDTGDLVPLGMRYPGTSASIPIQLTSIAATPDMALEVYVLGRARAVPDNYLHVLVNDGAIDWANAGANYPEVLARAVDEAGGQAFATEFSGSTRTFRAGLWWDGRFDFSSLASVSDPVEWVGEVWAAGAPEAAETYAVLEAWVPPPHDVDSRTFYANIYQFADDVDAPDFDPVAATADLDAAIAEPLRHAQALLDTHPHVTRLTTTLDPEEMTSDPRFVFNDSLPQEVSNQHTASRKMGNSGRTSPTELADGRRVEEPGGAAAWLIEDLGPDGAGEVVFDAGAGSCGCTSSAPSWWGAIWIAAVTLIRRRR